MKNRLLILCSVLVLVVALAAPAFATQPESLVDTKWVASPSPPLPHDCAFATYNLLFTAGGRSFSSIRFDGYSASDGYRYLVRFDDVTVFQEVSSGGSTHTLDDNTPDYSNLIITGGTDVKNDAVKKIISCLYTYEGVYVPPRPVHQAVQDAVTGGLPGILEIFGSILTALFTPKGDLFPLGSVIAACFVVALIYGGFRLYRKVTPGV